MLTAFTLGLTLAAGVRLRALMARRRASARNAALLAAVAAFDG